MTKPLSTSKKPRKPYMPELKYAFIKNTLKVAYLHGTHFASWEII